MKLLLRFYGYRFQPALIITFLAFTSLVACSTSNEALSFDGITDRELQLRIVSEVLAPSDATLFAAEADELLRYDIVWREIAHRNTGCQISQISELGTRRDWEIILFVWGKEGEPTARSQAVQSLFGEHAWKVASDLYGGAAFDCLISTEAYLKEQKAI